MSGGKRKLGGAPPLPKPVTGSTSAGNVMKMGPLYVVIPPDLKTLMGPGYNLSQAAAQAFINKYPKGYSIGYSGPGVENAPPTSESTFARAIEQMKASLGPALAQQLYNAWGIPWTGKSTAISDAIKNAFNLLYATGGDASQVNPSLWGAGGIVTATNAKRLNQMSQSEIAATINAAGMVNSANIQGHDAMAAALIGATAGQKVSAIDSVMNYLDNWGMATPEMSGLVNQLVNKDGLIHTESVLNVIRNTKTYENAFPGLTERNNKYGPGGEHMTELQYQQYVAQVSNLQGVYGLPRNFFTKADIGQYIANNVSAPEIESRIAKGYLAYQNADPQTKAILQSEYNMGPNLGAAYFLNSKRAQGNMERDIAQATLQSTASEAGLRGFNKSDAADLFNRMKLTGITNMNGALANPYSTYTMAQAKSDLLAAAKNQPLLASTIGAGAPTVTTRDLLAAQIPGFGGENQVAAQTAVERAAQAKVAPFEKGGGMVEDARGVVGAGAVSE